jgi:hypothetical protein
MFSDAKPSFLRAKPRTAVSEPPLSSAGDGMWRELARLASANESLEERIVQLTAAPPLSPTQSEPSPRTSPPVTDNGQLSSGSDGDQKKGSPTGSLSGRSAVRLSNDVAAKLNKAFGLNGSPTQSETEGVSWSGVRRGGVETTGGENGAAREEQKAPIAVAASERSGAAAESGRSRTSLTFKPPAAFAPSESVGPPRRSASASPASSPESNARKAEELSNRVFDRLAVLRQRYASEEAETPSPETVKGGGRKKAGSSGGTSENEGGSQDESRGALRNLVRWFEAKVPSRKSSANNSPREMSPALVSPTTAGQQRVPGGNTPSGNVRGKEASQPRAPLPRPPSREKNGNERAQKVFAGELPILDMRGRPSEEKPSGKAGGSPDSPGFLARLEILRERNALLREDSSLAGPSSENSAARRGGIPVPSPRLGAQPRIILDSSSDQGSPEPTRRTGALRQEERVSEGFGSPQANALPAFLSWVPPLEALGSAGKPPRVSAAGARASEMEKGVGGSGRWEDARPVTEGSGLWAPGAHSPSSVLERLAVLQSRGNASESLDLSGEDGIVAGRE